MSAQTDSCFPSAARSACSDSWPPSCARRPTPLDQADRETVDTHCSRMQADQRPQLLTRHVCHSLELGSLLAIWRTDVAVAAVVVVDVVALVFVWVAPAAASSSSP